MPPLPTSSPCLVGMSAMMSVMQSGASTVRRSPRPRLFLHAPVRRATQLAHCLRRPGRRDEFTGIACELAVPCVCHSFLSRACMRHQRRPVLFPASGMRGTSPRHVRSARDPLPWRGRHDTARRQHFRKTKLTTLGLGSLLLCIAQARTRALALAQSACVSGQARGLAAPAHRR